MDKIRVKPKGSWDNLVGGTIPNIYQQGSRKLVNSELKIVNSELLIVKR